MGKAKRAHKPTMDPSAVASPTDSVPMTGGMGVPASLQGIDWECDEKMGTLRFAHPTFPE